MKHLFPGILPAANKMQCTLNFPWLHGMEHRLCKQAEITTINAICILPAWRTPDFFSNPIKKLISAIHQSTSTTTTMKKQQRFNVFKTAFNSAPIFLTLNVLLDCTMSHSQLTLLATWRETNYIIYILFVFCFSFISKIVYISRYKPRWGNFLKRCHTLQFWMRNNGICFTLTEGTTRRFFIHACILLRFWF